MRRATMRRTLVLAGAALAVVAGLMATAVLDFPAARVGRALSGPTVLPASLEPFVFNMCVPDLDRLSTELTPQAQGNQLFAVSTDGSGRAFSVSLEASGVWRVDASRVGVTVMNENGTASPTDVAAALPDAVDAARDLYSCFSRYRFVDESTPFASSSQLVQWYKYDTVVLWPCLAAHGLKVGDPPSRVDFSDAFRAQAVDPFGALELTGPELPKVIEAVQQCPVRPAYLR